MQPIWEWAHDPNNPDAEPVLDKWGWDTYWDCNDWIVWHAARKLKYGQKKANDDFIYHFHQATLGAASISCRSLDSSFRDYARENGFLDALFTGIGGILATPIGVGNDVVNNTGNVISNIGSGIENTTDMLKSILPVLLLLVLVFASVYTYKTLNA